MKQIPKENDYFERRFQRALERHIKISRGIGKHFMKIGKKETSVVISQKVTIENRGDANLKTTITLLPIRRMYNDGDKILDDGYLFYEMSEDIEV